MNIRAVKKYISSRTFLFLIFKFVTMSKVSGFQKTQILKVKYDFNKTVDVVSIKLACPTLNGTIITN